MTIILVLTALFSAISEAVVITFPKRICDLVLKNDSDDEILEMVSQLSFVELSFIFLSFFQIPLIPLLFFSDIERFKTYSIILFALFIIGNFTKSLIKKHSSLIVVEAAIELLIMVDIIRSCIYSIAMR